MVAACCAAACATTVAATVIACESQWDGSEIVRDPVAGEELLQASVFFRDCVTFFCRGGEHFLQSEDFLLQSFDVHLFAFTVSPAASQLPW